MKRMVFWVLFIPFVGLVLSSLLSFGGKESVVEISEVGQLTIGALAALAGLSLLVWFVATSRAEAIDAELASMRRSSPAKWLVRVLAMTLGFAAATAVFSWLWVRILVRHLPATHQEMQGQVTRLIRTGGENPFCRYLIDVQLSSGSQVRICGELGVIARTVPHEMANLTKGELVTVKLRTTSLGVSATITRTKTDPR